MPTETICRAVRARKTLSFVYRNVTCTADPHIVGFDHSGHLLLSALQTGGGSGIGFRTFQIAGLSQIAETGQHFSPAGDYNPQDPIFWHIICQV
jgi:hypothetical protein